MPVIAIDAGYPIAIRRVRDLRIEIVVVIVDEPRLPDEIVHRYVETSIGRREVYCMNGRRTPGPTDENIRVRPPDSAFAPAMTNAIATRDVKEELAPNSENRSKTATETSNNR